MIMSQVYGFSRSIILMMALVLLGGFSPECGSCQEFTNESSSDKISYVDYETNMPIDDVTDALVINSRDLQSISTFSNGPLGLWSVMNTRFLDEDGTFKKSRQVGVFSYGSELMQIKEYSWLTAEDESGNELYSDGYNVGSTLKDAKLPFAIIRDDMITLSDLSLMDNDAVDSISITRLLLYEDFYESYDINALNKAFGGSSTVDEVLFRYDPELGSLDPLNQSSLDMSMFGDIWSEFGSVFNNPQIMEMFNEFAKKQLRRQQEEKDQKDKQIYIEHLFDECDGGVCVKWGTTI